MFWANTMAPERMSTTGKMSPISHSPPPLTKTQPSAPPAAMKTIAQKTPYQLRRPTDSTATRSSRRPTSWSTSARTRVLVGPSGSLLNISVTDVRATYRSGNRRGRLRTAATITAKAATPAVTSFGSTARRYRRRATAQTPYGAQLSHCGRGLTRDRFLRLRPFGLRTPRQVGHRSSPSRVRR